MGIKLNRDLLGTAIYAFDEGENWHQLGKVTDFTCTWPNRLSDIYDMELHITGPYRDQSELDTKHKIWNKVAEYCKNDVRATEAILNESFLMSYSKLRKYIPKKIIQNGPAFIVFWDDGSKTILKKKADDPDDPYAAFGQALMIKIFGTNSAAHRIVDRCYEKQEQMTNREIKALKEAINNIANAAGLPVALLQKEEDQNGGD